MFHAVGKGTIKLLMNCIKVMEFKNTLHFPKLKANLIYVADLISEYGLRSNRSTLIRSFHTISTDLPRFVSEGRSLTAYHSRLSTTIT